MREDLRRTFDRAAQLYDRVRPGYPDSLFEALRADSVLVPGARVLEVGPGTGQATSSLVAGGALVTAVELGPALAAVLASHPWAGDVDVVVGAFEDVPLEHSAPYDAVASFTAWHWLAAPARTRRAAELLQPAGALVTVTTSHVRGGTEHFFEDVRECYARWEITPPDHSLRSRSAGDPNNHDVDSEALLPRPEDVPPALDEADDDPVFDPAQRTCHLQQIAYTTAEYLDVLRTYSGTIAMSPERRNGLLSCVGTLIDASYEGGIEKVYLHELRVTRLSPDHRHV